MDIDMEKQKEAELDFVFSVWQKLDNFRAYAYINETEDRTLKTKEACYWWEILRVLYDLSTPAAKEFSPSELSVRVYVRRYTTIKQRYAAYGGWNRVNERLQRITDNGSSITPDDYLDLVCTYGLIEKETVHRDDFVLASEQGFNAIVYFKNEDIDTYFEIKSTITQADIRGDRVTISGDSLMMNYPISRMVSKTTDGLEKTATYELDAYVSVKFLDVEME